MARKNSRRHSRRHSRRQKGGNYSSASTYGMYVNGSGPSQFERTFSATGEYANRVGSEYVGAQGQWATQPNTASASNLSLIQSAGKRKRKGGFVGPILNQAVVPATLLAFQQTYRRKSKGSNKTFRHKKFSRRRY